MKLHRHSLEWLLVAAVVLFGWASETPAQSRAPGVASLLASPMVGKGAKKATADKDKDKDKDKDDDDDFDKPKKGPVDRKVHLSGVFATAGAFTWFNGHTLPDGSRHEDDHTLQIEHTHLKFSGDLTNSLSWSIMPCVIHMNDFSVIEARFTYAFHRSFQVTAGRFLLPFGQFNLRSLPGTFSTVSRPLLYQSHESRFINFADGTPRSFLFTPRDDVGVQFSGSVWLGKEETVQLSYQAYVTNGLRGVSDGTSRFWDDNNSGKQFGGRVTLGYFGEKYSVVFGVSGLLNEWEESLRQFAAGGDFSFSYELSPGRRLTLRGEYALMRREVKPGPELLQGDEEISGLYVTLEAKLLSWFGGFVQFDALSNRTPRALLNEGFEDVTVTMNRWLAGLLFAPVGGFTVLLEYSHWAMPGGFPDADRIIVQAVVVF